MLHGCARAHLSAIVATVKWMDYFFFFFFFGFPVISLYVPLISGQRAGQS